MPAFFPILKCLPLNLILYQVTKTPPMTDEYYMMLALKEAKRAYEEDEIPIGAIVILNGKVIARGYNMVEKLNDPTAHAEMIALTSAFNHLGSKYLPEATLYVTVE